MWKMVKRFRWLVYVILPFILSAISFGEMTVTQYEVGGYTRNTINSRSQLNSALTPDLESKLRETLELLEQPNPDQAKIGKLIEEIEELDQKIRADFAATENDLRGKNVSATILKRHQDFVAQYQENMETLKEGLKVYDPGFLGMNRLFSLGADSKAKETKAEDLKKKLREEWIPKEFNPFKDGKLPQRNVDFTPGEPDTFLSITPAYEYTQKAVSSFQLFQADNYQSGSEDLQETIEIQITPEIKELARHLDHNPVKIFEYVRNNIDYVPYYGSVKGAQETLWQKAGNDFDQASLLMALLRASGIPCRYVYGVVEIPMEKVKNWIGIEHDQTALNTFPTNGIPAKGIYIGDKAAFLRKEHVWVEALVPVNHYRGSGVDDSGKGWVPMDPSFKEYLETPGVDLTSEVPFDSEAILNQLVNSANIGNNGGSITGINQELLSSKLTEFQQNVKTFFGNELSNLTPEDIIGKRKIKAVNTSILSLSLPYQVVAVNNELSSLNSSYRQSVKLTITDQYGFSDDCVFDAPFSEIGSKKVSLRYIAATEADAQLLASQISSDPSVPSGSIPAYLIKVKPQIIIGDEIKATGNPVTMGAEQNFQIDFSYPTRVLEPMQHIENKVIAGAFYVITFNTGSVCLEHLQEKSNALQKAELDINNNNYDQIKPESIAGDFLHFIGLRYFLELDNYNLYIAKTTGVRAVRMVSEAMLGFDLKVDTIFGMPRAASFGGLIIDIDRDLHSAVHIHGNKEKVKEFFVISGTVGSFLEGGIFQRILGGQAVSTIHILNAANQQGIKIFTLNASNINEVLPQLQYDTETKNTFLNWISTGKEITVPENRLVIGGWNGSGYIVLDPENGTGAYLIDGGYNGGCIEALVELLKNVGISIVFSGVTPSSWHPGIGVVAGYIGLILAIKQYGEDLNLLLSGQYSPEVGDMICIDILIITLSMASLMVSVAALCIATPYAFGVASLIGMICMTINTFLTMHHSYLRSLVGKNTKVGNYLVEVAVTCSEVTSVIVLMINIEIDNMNDGSWDLDRVFIWNVDINKWYNHSNLERCA